MAGNSLTKKSLFANFDKKLTFRAIRNLIIAILLPKTFLFFLICGLFDVSRNAPLDKEALKKYFLGGGEITWLLSPFNLFCDLISFTQKTFYKLNELPQECQQEINTVIAIAKKYDLAQALNDKMEGNERGMMFFKWYGKNLDKSIKVDEFHQEYKYIQTIGISAFNKQKSTSRHYGPLRITLRVLYNLKPVDNDGVYIQVAGHRHKWHDNPLFVFDDTLIHQSFNNSDEIRYCMFIDIIRPSRYGYSISLGLLKFTRLIMMKVNHIFYKKWVVLN